MSDPLPHHVSSLSKYHRIDSHYEILKEIQADTPLSELSPSLVHSDLFITAQKRYLLIRNGVVIKDRLIDLIQSEQGFTHTVRMVMYFLFLFRDARYRAFICDHVADPRGKWDTARFRTSDGHFSRAGGHKAFTNLRRMLIHVGILEETTYSIAITGVEKWLPVALEIAAQYLEPEPLEALVASPHGFLIRNRLNALLNLTAEELARIDIGGTYEEASDMLPDLALPSGVTDLRSADFCHWDRKPPRKQSRRQAIKADPVAFERAGYQHWLLEDLTRRALQAAGAHPKTNRHIDLLFESDDRAILFEMKSCRRKSIRTQFRRAVSQLLEYKFLYRKHLPPRRVLMHRAGT